MIQKVIAFTGLISSLAFLGAAPYPLSYIDPAAKQSQYSKLLPKLLEHWPLPTNSIPDTRPVSVRAIRTPDRPYYIGMVKHFTVHVPMERAAEVIEKFEDYPKIWEDLVTVKVESTEGNRTVTSWVRKSPTFLMANIRFRMAYIVDKSVPDRISYRQQLIDSNTINYSDGLIVLDKIAPDSTRMSIILFFDADFSILRGLIEGVIWRRSVEGSFKDDIAFRARVEHPDWNLKRITQEAEDALDHNSFDQIPYTDAIRFN